MIDLPNVQLVAIIGGGPKPPWLYAAAMRQSMKKISFGAATLITWEVPPNVPEGVRVVQEKPFDIAAYNDFALFELPRFVTKEFVMIVQHDGFVTNPELWTDKFLAYDYIGAPWPARNMQPCRVGNGGFCIRSRRLLEVVANMRERFPRKENEDAYICTTYRAHIEAAGITFAPPELAARFSVEFKTHYHDGGPTFGFHGFYDGREQTCYQKLLQI